MSTDDVDAILDTVEAHRQVTAALLRRLLLGVADEHGLVYRLPPDVLAAAVRGVERGVPADGYTYRAADRASRKLYRLAVRDVAKGAGTC